MVDESTIAWIKEQIEEGRNEEKIMDDLRKEGASERQIREIKEELRGESEEEEPEKSLRERLEKEMEGEEEEELDGKSRKMLIAMGIIGLLIVVLVGALIAGGVYLWINNSTVESDNNQGKIEADRYTCTTNQIELIDYNERVNSLEDVGSDKWGGTVRYLGKELDCSSGSIPEADKTCEIGEGGAVKVMVTPDECKVSAGG